MRYLRSFDLLPLYRQGDMMINVVIIVLTIMVIVYYQCNFVKIPRCTRCNGGTNVIAIDAINLCPRCLRIHNKLYPVLKEIKMEISEISHGKETSQE